MRTTTHGAQMSPRMERLWAFIQDEQKINLCDFSTDECVEREQARLRVGEKALLARVATAPEDREAAALLRDYQAVMNRRPVARVDGMRSRGGATAPDEIDEMVKGKVRSW